VLIHPQIWHMGSSEDGLGSERVPRMGVFSGRGGELSSGFAQDLVRPMIVILLESCMLPDVFWADFGQVGVREMPRHKHFAVA